MPDSSYSGVPLDKKNTLGSWDTIMDMKRWYFKCQAEWTGSRSYHPPLSRKYISGLFKKCWTDASSCCQAASYLAIGEKKPQSPTTVGNIDLTGQQEKGVQLMQIFTQNRPTSCATLLYHLSWAKPGQGKRWLNPEIVMNGAEMIPGTKISEWSKDTCSSQSFEFFFFLIEV